MQSTWLVIVIVVVALGFDYTNGFHDSANAIATVVATRVLRPSVAVLMAGGLNLAGALSGTSVAVTLGTGIVDPKSVSETTVAVALLCAGVSAAISIFLPARKPNNRGYSPASQPAICPGFPRCLDVVRCHQKQKTRS